MKKRMKSLLILALPYMITICFPIISTIFFSDLVTDNFHEKMLVEKQKSIESAFDRFLQKADGIERLMYAAAKSNEMTEYVSLIKSNKPITSKYLAVKDMLGSLMIDSNVLAMYYYDMEDQRVITNDASYRLAERYFANRYILREYTAEEHIGYLNALPKGMGYSESLVAEIDNSRVEVIEYRMSLPLAASSTLKGYLVMIIDVEELFCDFTEILEEGSEIYVYDSSNKLIYGSGNQYGQLLEVSDGGNLRQLSEREEPVWGMVCQQDSWKIKLFIPGLHGSGVETKPTMTLWTVLPIVTSFIFCVYFTIKNYREIREILYLFKDHTKNEGIQEEELGVVGYRHIRDQVNYLMSENKDYREKLNIFSQSHKYTVLDKLIRNTYDHRETIAEELRQANLNISDGKCIVLCIRYKSSEYRTMVTEGLSLKDFVNEMLYQVIEKNVEIFDTSARETICIISLSEEDDTNAVIREICSAINVEIVYSYGIEMEIGVGNAVNTLLAVSDSYVQAREVISYNEAYGKKVWMYSELENRDDIYYYPPEFDDKIYNYLLAGKESEAKELVSKIYKENFERDKKRNSNYPAEEIRERVGKCIVGIAEKNGLEKDVIVNRLDQAFSVHEYFAVVFTLIDEISRDVNSKKQSIQNQSAVRVMNYIKENYCDSELSLKRISAILGYNEHYISDLFRNIYDEKLSDVIEKMRIETACELMRDENMKINDIAQRVGYNSDVSFRRAFKKIMGVRPSEYKGT